MHMLADPVEVVIGVDTHKHTTPPRSWHSHRSGPGRPDRARHPDGYQQLLELAARQPGQRIWAIESTGGYGAGLTRFLHGHAEPVVSWIGASGPPGATAPSLTRWTPPGPPARRWAVTSWPSPERPDHEPPCRCDWPPAARRSRPPATPNASSTPWSSPHPTSCGNGSGSARPASWWPPAPGCASSPAGTLRPPPRPRPCRAWPVGSGSYPPRPPTTAKPSWGWCGPGARPAHP